MALDRWAVVTWVMPPASGPSSRTTTDLPALVSRYAVDSPAMPAPTTQTSARVSSRSGEQSGIRTVAAQTDWPRGTLAVAWLFMSGHRRGKRLLHREVLCNSRTDL